ncbi:MAG: hypothetical protein P4L10_11145 [Acidobacteriaceae bacterium]|nr:hypothetical protein [Acidobacteriaceae bacterium]
MSIETSNARAIAQLLIEARRESRIASLVEAHRIAQDVMRLSADTGSTGTVVGVKVVRDRIQSLIEEASK